MNTHSGARENLRLKGAYKELFEALKEEYSDFHIFELIINGFKDKSEDKISLVNTAYIFEDGESEVMDIKERDQLQEKLKMPDWVIEKYYKFA